MIIPCYNVEHEIDRLMECLAEQTIGIKNLEIILVNDGSEDDTLAHLIAWEKRYEENILVINCTQNNGMSYARNVVLDAAQGMYISFIDADDWIAPNYMERMVQVSETYQSDITICGHDRPSMLKEEKNTAVISGKESWYQIDEVNSQEENYGRGTCNYSGTKWFQKCKE